MKYKINKQKFNDGIYKVNDDMFICLFDDFKNDRIDSLKIFPRLYDDKDYMDVINLMKNGDFNDDNCLIIRCGILSDDYYYLYNLKYDCYCLGGMDKIEKHTDDEIVSIMMSICNDVLYFGGY